MPFLGDGDGEDCAAGPLQRTYVFCEGKCINESVLNAAAHRRTWNSSKVESTYWKFFTSQVFGLTLYITVVCTILWTLTKWAQPDTCAVRPIHAWRLARREASYACVVPINFCGFCLYTDSPTCSVQWLTAQMHPIPHRRLKLACMGGFPQLPAILNAWLSYCRGDNIHRWILSGELWLRGTIFTSGPLVTTFTSG